MSQKTVAVVVGSIRKESFNRQFAEALVKQFPAELKAQFIRIDDLPLYNQDDDGNPAPQVTRLRGEIKAADAVLFVTAEYNRSIPGVLKNALDWVSRTKGGVWRDKPLAIVSAADGRPGGARSQFALRLSMVTSRAAVLPAPEVLIGDSSHAFGADGQLIDPRGVKVLTELMGALRAEAEKRRT